MTVNCFLLSVIKKIFDKINGDSSRKDIISGDDGNYLCSIGLL